MLDEADGPRWDGDVQRTSASALAAAAAAGREARLESAAALRAVLAGGPSRPVGDVLVAGVTDAGRTLARAAVTAMSAPMCAEPQLLAGLAGVDSLRARVDRLNVVLLVEAHRRGLHLDTGLSVHDWVAVRCPGLTKAAVGDLATVVKAWDHPGHASIRDAVTAGQVSPARAAKLVRALARVAPVTTRARMSRWWSC